jgi:hypothetical protein
MPVFAGSPFCAVLERVTRRYVPIWRKSFRLVSNALTNVPFGIVS